MKNPLKIEKLTIIAVVFAAISCHVDAARDEGEYIYVTETNVIETIVVRRSGISIDVPDAGVVFEVGDRLPLFQTNSDGYVAGMERLDGQIELIAFPKRGPRDEPTGWVTNDKYLIFARNARSAKGELKLDRYEVLDVLNTHADHVEVILRRFGRETLLRIPSRSSGFKRSEREVTFRRKIAVTPEDKKELASLKRLRPVKAGRKISVRYGEDEGMVIENAQGERIHQRTPGTVTQNAPETSANIVFVGPGFNPESETSSGSDQRIAGTKPDSSQRDDIAKSTQAREQVVAELKEVVMLEIMAELRKAKDTLAENSEPEIDPEEEAEGEGIRVTELDADAPTKADIVAIVRQNTGVSEAQGDEGPKPVQNTEDTLTLVKNAIEEPVEVATQALDVATASAVASVMSEHTPQGPESESAPPTQERRADGVGPILGFFISNTLMFQILLLVCILEGAMLIRLQKQQRKTQAQPEETASASDFFSIESSGESFISESLNESASDKNPGDLTGTLDGYGLGQVIQFFNSSGDSGILTVITLQGDKETMTFKDGQIIQAKSGNLTKDEAVYQIMRRSEGSFDFTRQDTHDLEVEIVQDTMSLLLEGSRLADEKGFDNGV